MENIQQPCPPPFFTTKRIALLVLVVFTIGFGVGFAVCRTYAPRIELPIVSIERDTVTTIDTINGKPQEPRKQRIIRVDTARINLKPAGEGKFEIDTITPAKPSDTSTAPRITPQGDIAIPISSKIYKTDDYRAVVSGWRASLDSIEVYARRQTITNTITKYKPPRWAVTAGGGVGYTPDKKVVPMVGISIGLVLWSK